MTELAVGLVQCGTSPGQTQQNVHQIAERAGVAFERGAELVVVPELAASGYAFPDRGALARAAEPVPGPSTDSWVELCQRHGGWICGGVAEMEGLKLFDSAVLVGPDGILLRYRKLHLFGNEKTLFDPGDEGLPVVELPFGQFGALVCYDLRFPEATRLLALRGAQVVGVPTAWVTGFDRMRIDESGLSPQAQTARVMANVNQIFICAASQVGRHGGVDFLGGSLVVDPRGEIPMGPLSVTENEVAVATVDTGASADALSRGEGISPRSDRRIDVYSIRYEGRDH